ncbi:MAG: hypothetical protein CME70_09500 [Halobacteriovorax sp.]|nr:hypothetical protein [Halobacteriovorax sp.]|tara:strand:+ start:168332 stop:168880 length:549 start_codon:yes stop_codon:yes gene_type:complete
MNKVLLLVSSILLSLNINAATLDKVTMPDSVNVKGKDLVLNGLGTRKATWLRVKVYVGGLYLEKKSKDPQTILNSNGVKYIRMHFVRDVKGEKLINGWNEAFASAVKDRSKIQKRIDELNALMGDVKKNQEIVLTFTDKDVHIEFANSKSGTIKGGDFSKALLSVWFINAKDEGLRDGLLGL